MEFYEVVEKRRTIREFTSQPIDEAIMERVLGAGLKAPSNNHLRQWEFILVRDPQVRRQLVESGEKLKESIPKDQLNKTFEGLDPLAREMYLDAVPKQKRMLLAAPELLVVAYKYQFPAPRWTRIYDLNDLASIWCCIENILLAMAAEGIFGVTYVPKYTDLIGEILGIPGDYTVAALIPMGYPSPTAKILTQKKIDPKKKIHINKW